MKETRYVLSIHYVTNLENLLSGLQFLSVSIYHKETRFHQEQQHSQAYFRLISESSSRNNIESQ